MWFTWDARTQGPMIIIWGAFRPPNDTIGHMGLHKWGHYTLVKFGVVFHRVCHISSKTQVVGWPIKPQVNPIKSQ